MVVQRVHKVWKAKVGILDWEDIEEVFVTFWRKVKQDGGDAEGKL